MMSFVWQVCEMSVTYQGDHLFVGKHDLYELMRERKGHPCYVYDLQNIKDRYAKLLQSLEGLSQLSVHYALKANAHPQILKCLKSLGSRVDVVSGGELQHALDQGFSGDDIIFSGVAKSVEEIELALQSKIRQINVESPQELRRIGELALQYKQIASVAFRMNPEVSPETHPYITTGMSENKFGMDRSFIPELVAILQEYKDHLNLRGLTMHIGSQLTDLSAMKEAIQKLLAIGHEFQVFGYPVSSLDIGGGVGIHYNTGDEAKDFTLMEEYGRTVVHSLKDFKGEILIEPGRVLVARSGVLLCQVEYIKSTPHKNFAIVNTGMHHLMRPALYQAQHRILPLQQKNLNKSQKLYDVVGPICESSDFLAKNYPMPELQQGDYLAICDAGAYGFSMANNYNMHGLPDEIILSQ
jgi:diaminopimelate decarboxylase